MGLIDWIKEEHLQMFFDKEISKDKIRDLAGSNNVKENRPPNTIVMIDRYINILIAGETLSPDEN